MQCWEALMSLYDVLLVDQNASLDEIKLAFKRRALQVHPDKGGSKEEFHLVYQALETLGDPAARQKVRPQLSCNQDWTSTTCITSITCTISKRKKEEERRETRCEAGHKLQLQRLKQSLRCLERSRQLVLGTAPSKPTQATAKATPGKKSATSPCKAPSSSKPPQAAATPAEPQSKQTKLLMKIRDLLKRLPRDARNDVITNQLSQKQRVLLEKFMVDNAGTSGAQGHSEVNALAPAAGKRAPNQSGFDNETSPRQTPASSHGNCLLALPATNSVEANPARRFAHSVDKTRHPKNRTRTAHGAICNEPGHSVDFVNDASFSCTIFDERDFRDFQEGCNG